MDAIGRTLSVIVAAVGVVLFWYFFRMSPMRAERERTVESIVSEFVSDVMRTKCITYADTERLDRQLQSFEDYEVIFTISMEYQYRDADGIKRSLRECSVDEMMTEYGGNLWGTLFVAEVRKKGNNSALFDDVAYQAVRIGGLVH